VGRVARLRAAAPLELFFDLCFVAAVAQAASHLHHDLSQGHLAHALGNYLWVFFAIWWAWMNFTWFASVYDNDDDLYRLLTLVQIAGALVMAAPHRTQVQQGLAVGAPLAVWILTVWWLRVSPLARGPALVASPLAAVLVLAAAWTPDGRAADGLDHRSAVGRDDFGDTAPTGRHGVGRLAMVVLLSFALQGDGQCRLLSAGEVGAADPDRGDVDGQGEQGDPGGDQEAAGEPGGEGMVVDRSG